MARTHLPCSDCGSSDGLTEYDDGSYCFVCGTLTKEEGHKEKNVEDPLTRSKIHDILSVYYKEYTLRDDLSNGLPSLDKDLVYDSIDGCSSTNSMNSLIKKKDTLSMEYRKLNNKTLVFYNIIYKDNLIFYPYNKGKGFKVRNTLKKEFYTEGEMRGTSGIFGKELFAPGGKAITLTEGENDAMAVFQMNGGYAACSVRSAGSAVADCKADYDYINSFDRIYLCFDTDDAGEKALKAVAGIFNPNKVYHIKLSKHKDAHAYLEADDVVLFNKEWWAAKPYLPSGIVGDYDSIREILDQESAMPVATYPYKLLQEMTYGIRLGEINLITAQEKVGKTEIIRSIEYHLLKTTDYNLGIIHLEEPEKRTVQGLVGYELKTPVHLPDSGVSNQEALEVYKQITKRDNRCYLYKHFGSDDPEIILSTIRYLVAACECKFIFLDHITMLVTGFHNDDERKTLDYLSTQLAMMTRELNFTLFLVSHVNDDGKTRGSRNISKVADLILHLDRNLEASTISERNKTNLLIKGNRWAGLSGPSSTLFFDQGTFTYSEQTMGDEENPEIFTGQFEGSDHRPSSLWTEATPERRDEISPPHAASDPRLLYEHSPSTSETLGLEGVETRGGTHGI